MKTIKSLKDITTLEVDDVVVFGNLEYTVCHIDGYFLRCSSSYDNDKIFTILNISKRDFVRDLGISTLPIDWDFPETRSLEALTAIVSALFKEYEKQNELPKTWDEFCEKYPLKEEETFINSDSNPITIGDYFDRRYRIPDKDKNLCTSKQETEAFLALIQLRQLRKCYVGDWEPDWKDAKQYKAIIMYNGIDFVTVYFKDLCSRPLSFPTYELAIQFFNNFKDLLEIAKPLL